jgi:RHS repeat-associated protein
VSFLQDDTPSGWEGDPLNKALFRRASTWLAAIAVIASLLPGAPVRAQDAPPPEPAKIEREELVARRTQSSKTFRNADGTLTTSFFSGPVHFRARDGKWREIDSTFVPAEKDGYALRNGANAFDVLFKDDLRDGYVRVSSGGMDFDLSLSGAARAAIARRHSNGVRFESAYPNVDLDYELLDTGLKETLVLEDASAPTRYRFVMKASGGGEAYVGRTPKGAWAIFTSRAAEPALVFEPPTVLESPEITNDPPPEATPSPSPSPSPSSSPDAPVSAFTAPEATPSEAPSEADSTPQPAVSATPESGPKGEGPAEARPSRAEASPSRSTARGMQQAADLHVRELGKNKFELVLQLDPQWLHDPERQFPVLLDPTVLTVQSSSEDASYAWMCGGCTAFGANNMYIGAGYSDIWRSVVRFDLGGVPIGTVTNATLNLRYDGTCGSNSPPCGASPHVIDLHRMTGAWDWGTTVNNLAFQPAPFTSYTINPGSTNLWMNWNVTALAQTWVSDLSQNHGVLLKRSTESLGTGGVIAPIGRRHAQTTLRPKLEITYADLPVTLDPPETWHSNGAELSWSKYNSSVGAAFPGYQVHRSTPADFGPTADTLLAAISDIATTRFVDTTAGPNSNYTYRIVTGGIASNARSGSTPDSGFARKSLNGRWGYGEDTHLMYDKNYQVCDSFGQYHRMWVGSTTWSKLRSMVRFDVGDIPPNAEIVSAWLGLHREGWLPWTPFKVNVHRVTRDWSPGNSWSGCTWPGANWYTSDGVGKWASEGADFDPAVEASFTEDRTTLFEWSNWNVSSLVTRWVRGEVPNFGFLLKAETEPMTDDWRITYDTAENYTGEQYNPTLQILYRDGSRSIGPSVTIASPGPGERARGATPVKVNATDDRRVTKVELLVDGNVVAADTSAPYDFSWSSTSVSNGSRSLTAKAYDDVGNATVSAAVPVDVANSAPPTAQVTQPAAGATVSGTPTVSVAATDDTGVSKVEFYFDGYRFGEDLVADGTTYSAPWNTLDPALPAYNGAHQLTAVAVDAHGQRTESPVVNVTVVNAPSTKFKATYSTTSLPQAVTFDPAPPSTCGATGTQLCPQLLNGVDVTATNTSGVTWLATDVVARYRWYAADGTLAATGPNVPLGANVASGGSKVVRVDVSPPALANGVDRGQYTLRLDLYDIPSGAYFSEKGNTPVDASVTVHRLKATDQLGLERFYHYEGRELGAGMVHLLNVGSGNSLIRWTPFASPGRGLSTVLDLTYNSLEDKSDSPAGNNFSLSLSGLTRLGNPLDVHPNKADEIAGNTRRYIRFIDGDGTTHEFTGRQTAGGTIYWEEPAGVHLFLRTYSSTNPNKKWALTRPDRVTFFYDVDGYPTSVEDANGNKVVFGLETIPPGEDPGGPSKRVITVTDAAGVAGASGRQFTIDYYSKSEATKPQVRGNVQRITDHNGSAVDFDYYEDGNLLRLTQRGGTKADGTFLGDRAFGFTYTTSSGSAAAIPDAAARVNPDPRTPNQSTHLYSVQDPRGNETTFTYLGSGSGTARWRLSSIKDRAGQTTSILYDAAARKTSVLAPLSRTTTYAFDSEGKVTSILDPRNDTTSIAWTADRHVARVTEPTLKFTEYKYNPNGYLTEARDQLGQTALLEYENLPVPGENGSGDARDAAAYWKAGRTVPHLSQLKKVTDPRLNFSSFTYDPKGNVTAAKDEAGFDTLFEYDPANGNLTKVTDPNGNATTFSRYDPNGLPQEIRNAEGETTEFAYDADGLLRWVQTPMHSASPETVFNASYFAYDSFHRMGRRSSPKASDAVVWSGVDFDANDNAVTQLWAAAGTPGTIAAAAGSKTTVSYDTMDRVTLVDGPVPPPPAGSTERVDDRTKIDYDAAGRVTSVTAPKGLATPGIADDFTTFVTYDVLDRATAETRYQVDSAGTRTQTRKTHYCYNLAGDLSSVTAPRAELASVTCGTSIPFTTAYAYDDAHRLKTVTRPGSRVRAFGYDANGNVTSVKNELLDETLYEYDKRNLLQTIREPFDGTRRIVSRYVYDGAGNVNTFVSPKAWDASADSEPNKVSFADFITEYVYDRANRVTAVKLPRQGSETRHFLHRSYDDDGRMTLTSLPTTAAPSLDGSWPVSPALTTEVGYFRNGWIRSTNDAANPLTTYGYTPEGWQATRVIGGVEQEQWRYHPDGLLQAHVDRRGQSITYAYDGNGNLEKIIDGSGNNDGRDNLEIKAAYNGFDEPVEIRHQDQARPDDDSNWTFTTYSYDGNGNLKERVDDGAKGADGVVRGRRHTFSYNDVDWLVAHRDWGKANECADDQWVDNVYLPTGLQEHRVIRRATSSCTLSPDQPGWSYKQGTKWTYAKNGKLTKLETRNGDTRPGATNPGVLIESHNVSYLATIGGRSVYVNGHRTRDAFTLAKSGHSCVAIECVLTYQYDSRDRLTRQTRTIGSPATATRETSWVLDPAGNVLSEDTPAIDSTYTYVDNRLSTVTSSGSTARYLYDGHGNVECVVKGSYSGTVCPNPGPDLLTAYTYDAFDRLKAYRALGGDTTAEISTEYVYDVLDRVEKERETRPAFKRNIDFTYVGLTDQVAKEIHDDPASATATTRDVTKSYGYDPFGLRLSMTNAPASTTPSAVGKPGTFTYAYDVHGSVSALLDGGGNIEAAYGYDAYGKSDPELSSGDNDPLLQLNAYRYTGKRSDVGSGTIDMGARRFATDASRFLQPDVYQGALANLGLSADPLTGNRYALAAGNPVSFVEVDGHMLAKASGGGGNPSDPPRDTDDLGGAVPLSQGNDDRSDGLLGGTPIGRAANALEETVSSLPPFKQVDDSLGEDHPFNTADQTDDAWGALNAISWLYTGSSVATGLRNVVNAVRSGASAAGKQAVTTGSRHVVGFATGEAASALTTHRLQHATRHLVDKGLLPVWQGTKSPALIRQTLGPLLENPIASADDVTQAGLRVKVFISELGGEKIAISIFKEGHYRGEIATAVVASTAQLAKWGAL